MRPNGHIKLRHFDAFSANFTLPIRRRSRPLLASPLSLKKLTDSGWKYGDSALRPLECPLDEVA